MSAERCPICRGTLDPGAQRCRWCNNPVVPIAAEQVQAGDVVRIRNRFKGNHVEAVTVIRVERDGYGLEVQDEKGLIWGTIFAPEVLEVLGRARHRA